MEDPTHEPIAIVGAACRFAGEASSLGSLWDMIRQVKTGHGRVPADRWDSEQWYHPDPDRKGGISTQHGYFLQQDISHFDAPFFSITAKEAAAMDPIKRLLLEVTYESIENAGIPVEKLMNSRTGCYVGCMTNDYEMTSLHDIYNIGHAVASGLSEAMTANRISWFYGLKGPSLTLDTACSSSLYALHLACQSLRLKETNMSLVAGVNLMINPNTMHQLTAMHMLSPEGISHTFDDRANGYGRGDGMGALIVKRLSDAIRDGDTIRAVIRGTGANADGKTPSVTQPSSAAQAELINQTYADAGLVQSDTAYCECHGTGTPVGDPLELSAIAETLGASRRTAGKDAPLYVGSIKPTVGHTEGCAGLAGVFKSILLLEKGMLVPTYGVERVNPKLKLHEWNLALPEGVVPWPTSGLRRISVNSFGFGGANAHVILDDAYHYLRDRGLTGRHNTVIHSGYSHPIQKVPHNGLPSAVKRLFLISGKDQAAAQRVSEGVHTWLQEDSPDRGRHIVEDLSYTLALRRTHLEYRTFAIASSHAELTDRLSKGLPPATRARHGDNLVMVFTGQGAQWPGMGRELFDHPVFRKSIETSQSHLVSLGCNWNALGELARTPNPNVNRPEYSQPLCTVLQVALVDVLRSWKITPTATIGHSSGEIAAAYAASLLTHRDAVKLAYVRGLSSAAVPKEGAMMAAGLTQDEAEVYLNTVPLGSAVVACVNSPSSVTLSGDVDAIDQLEARISGDGKFARKLKVTTAYHSPHMREVSSSYLEMIGEICPPTDAADGPVMYSSLTGSLVTSAHELGAEYWVNNMQSPVQFSQALQALLKHKKVGSSGSRPVPVQWGAFLEVGPHAALQGPVRQTLDASNNKFAKAAPYASMLVRGKDAADTSLQAAGTVWAAGYPLDMVAVNQHAPSPDTPRMLCNLPPYPWNHSRSFWHESYSARAYRFPPHVRSDFLGMPEDAQSRYEPRWRNYLRIAENPWIEDHTITGTVLYPGAGMLIMAVEGVLRTADPSRSVEGFRMTDVMFERGLVISLDDESPVETRISFYPHDTTPEAWRFTVYSMTNGMPWTKHCAGTVGLVYASEASEVEEGRADAAWERQRGTYHSLRDEPDAAPVNVEGFYKHLDTIGMQYGPAFRSVVSLTAVPSQDASYGTVAVPDTRSTMPKQYESPHVIHPATMDSIFHLVIASLNTGRPVEQAAVPYHIDEIYVARDQPRGAGALYAGYGRLLSQTGHEITTELVVSDPEWETPRLTVKNFALRQVTAGDEDGVEMKASAQSPAIKNCASINWVPDLDFVTSDEDLTRLVAPGIDSWLDAVFLKDASITVLVTLFDESDASMDMLRRLQRRTYGPTRILAVATSEPRLQLMQDTLAGAGSTTITYSWLCEEELLQTLAPEANDLVIALGVPDIGQNAATLARLAPLACLMHTPTRDGLEVVVPGSKCVARTTLGESSVLLASSPTSPSVELPSSVVLLMPETPSNSLTAFATNIQTKLEESGVSVTYTTLTTSNMGSLGGKSVISLLEVDQPLVYCWDEGQFLAFQALVANVSHLFWITHGGVLESWSNGVEFATSQGLFRVMRNEYPAAVLPSLDLSAVADLASVPYARLVFNVWRTSLVEDADMEYAEGQGMIYVPRAVEAADFDHELQRASDTAAPVEAPLGELGIPLIARGSTTGTGCIWIPDEQAALPLEADEVEIQVEYVGLGTSPAWTAMQHAVGVVHRRADSANAFALGQRVVVFSHTPAGTHVRQSQALVAPLPDGLQPAEAVALVEPAITALYALREVAHLQSGQAVLVDDAASAVGQALVQVARAIGATVFALVSSRSDRDLLANRLGMPTDNIFDVARSNFVPLIQDATHKRGVATVVSQQAGAHVTGALSILSPFGHFVELNGDRSKSMVPASQPNVTLSRICMDAVFEGQPDVVRNLFQKAFTEYVLEAPSALTTLPVTGLPMKDHLSTNPVVVRMDGDSPVHMPAPPPSALQLDPDATYVLAGGLGALGLNIAHWMVDCGATHLVFLSRSGGSKNRADLERFAQRAVRTDAFPCDVNDAVSVATVFDTLKARGHRIAGVIQLAMVLDDGIFDHMSFSQWRRAIEPKTRGSRNLLANLWPGDKPFFLLLSSITGVIGNTAQANYAAGNTFEDALAHHARAHLDIPATSIDVGLVTDSAHFTAAGEFGDLAGYLGRYAHGWRGLQTTLAELGVVMRALMRSATTPRETVRAPAQLVLGMGDRISHRESTGGFARDRKFVLRVAPVDDDVGEGRTQQDVGALLARATSLAEAAAIVEENIKGVVAAAMGVAVDQVDALKPLYDYGVDSLQAVEIRNRALKNMRSDISVFDILSAMPLAEVAAKIAGKSQLVQVAVGPGGEIDNHT